jgi:hypothetical protein
MLHQEMETDLLDSSSYQKFLLYIMKHHQSRSHHSTNPCKWVGGCVPKKSRKHWHPFAHLHFLLIAERPKIFFCKILHHGDHLGGYWKCLLKEVGKTLLSQKKTILKEEKM